MYLHHDPDGHTESSVMVYPTSGLVTIRVRMLPGYTSWSRPDAATIRRVIDKAIAESDTPTIKRTTRLKWATADDGWWGTVDTTTVQNPGQCTHRSATVTVRNTDGAVYRCDNCGYAWIDTADGAL